MTSITIHQIEKVEIEKYWLDTGTFVVKLTIIDKNKVRNDIILFSKKSETFNDINQNIKSN